MVYNSLKIATLLAIGSTLVACSSNGLYGGAENYYGNGYEARNMHHYYQERRGYYSSDYSAERSAGNRGVSVPQSYHFSQGATPTKSSTMDSNWIAEQNPEAFTIQLDANEKPAPVAQTIYSTPKNAKAAQYKSMKDGKTIYTGVYGTFENKEAAEAAIADLPPKTREKAQIRQWRGVQTEATTTSSDTTNPASPTPWSKPTNMPDTTPRASSFPSTGSGGTSTPPPPSATTNDNSPSDTP